AIDIRSRGSRSIRWTKPPPSRPSRLAAGTRTSSKNSSAVSCAWSPILSSLRPRLKPSMPRSTTSRLMPWAPFSESVRATTMTRSDWMPFVMKVLAPLRTQWSPSRTAVVRTPCRSLPAPGSVIAIAPMHSPDAMPGSQRASCSSVPRSTMYGIAMSSWRPNPELSDVAHTLASSSITTQRKRKSCVPRPPNCSGMRWPMMACLPAASQTGRSIRCSESQRCWFGVTSRLMKAWTTSRKASWSCSYRPRRMCLLSLPHRGALLRERPGSFLRILRGEHRRHDAGHLVPAFVGGPVGAAVGDLLGGHQRQRTVGGDLAGQLDRRVQRLAVVHDPVDQADVESPAGIERVAGEQHLEREGARDAPGQQQRPARAGHQRALDLGHAELGGRARHYQVAGHGQLEAAGQGVALGRGDHRLARRGLGDAGQTAAGERGRLPLEERLEVHAGRERAARPGEHADRERTVRVELVDRVPYPGRDRPVDGVARLRPVDGNDLHRAPALDQYL